MKTPFKLTALLIATASALTVTPLSAIKIVVPDQYKDQVEAIKEAERSERKQELQGANESTDSGLTVDLPEGEAEDNQSPEDAADEFLVQSVIEATDAATEFELNLAAGEGIISGQIIDKESGQPLSGVAILLEDTNIATVTDSEGRYSIGPAPAGEYTVSFVKTGYIEANVTDYAIVGGEVSVFPFGLPPRPADMSDEVYELQDFTVTAEQANQLMVALLDMRQASVASLDVLGSEDFSRFGASDAADALKSVTGVSISGGKFAVVRGLDDRFSTTSLNGIVIPSPDPDRLAVPLDIFPAGLLESVSTQKSYTADQPGESSGGAINLTTKSFPEEFKAKLSAGISYSENATGEDGFLFAETEKFQGSPFGFAPKRKTPGLGTSLSGEIGDTIDWRDLQFGTIGGFSYGEKYSYSKVERNRLSDDGDNATIKSSSEQELSEYEEQLSALVGLGVKLSDETSINYTGLYSAKNEAVGTFSRIENDASSDDIYEISASTVEREYWNHQVVFDHTFDNFFGIKDFGMVASYAYSENTQDEPDTRVSDTLKESTSVTGSFDSDDFGQPVRYQRYLDQTDNIFKLDFEAPINPSWVEALSFKFGFSNEDTVRIISQKEFVGAQFEDATTTEMGTSNPEIEVFPGFVLPGSPHFIEIPGTTLIDTGAAEGTREIRSVYLQSTLSPIDKLELTVGARLEHSYIEAVPLEPGVLTRFVFEPVVESAPIDESSALPAFTATYDATDELKFRFGISQTIAKPSFRELNPNPSFNPATGEAEFGNAGVSFQNAGATDTVLPEAFSGLQLVEVDNFDIRGEWFLSDDELISVSLFHKKVDGPIERIKVPTGGGASFTFFNNDNEAEMNGAEFEFRVSMSRLSDWLRDFYSGGNYTYIDASVERSSLEAIALPGSAPNERSLFNQPENILNAFIGYQNEEYGLDVTLSANQVGRQLYAVTSEGDIFNDPYLSLNLVVGWKITDHWAVKFSSKNLLDPAKERSYDTFGDINDPGEVGDDGGVGDSSTDFSVRDSYRSGRSYSFSASYTF